MLEMFQIAFDIGVSRQHLKIGDGKRIFLLLGTERDFAQNLSLDRQPGKTGLSADEQRIFALAGENLNQAAVVHNRLVGQNDSGHFRTLTFSSSLIFCLVSILTRFSVFCLIRLISPAWLPIIIFL
jgi:hypothetical protein